MEPIEKYIIIYESISNMIKFFIIKNTIKNCFFIKKKIEQNEVKMYPLKNYQDLQINLWKD